VSNGSTLDVRELLRLIAEQQASFVRLQQLVVEHVLSESQPGFSTVNTPPAPAASHPVAATDVSNAAPPAYHTTSDPEVVRSTEPEPVPAAPASTPLESGAALSDPPETVPPPPGGIAFASFCFTFFDGLALRRYAARRSRSHDTNNRIRIGPNYR
jgi:hypothetical protein